MTASRLQVAVTGDALPQVNAFLQDALATQGLDAAQCYPFELALEELLVNVMTHGTDAGDSPRTFEVEVDVVDGEVCMTVADDGRPFDPLALAAPDVDLPLEQREIGGLGIHLIREMMDSVTYEHDGRRNRLTMRKRVA